MVPPVEKPAYRQLCGSGFCHRVERMAISMLHLQAEIGQEKLKWLGAVRQLSCQALIAQDSFQLSRSKPHEITIFSALPK